MHSLHRYRIHGIAYQMYQKYSKTITALTVSLTKQNIFFQNKRSTYEPFLKIFIKLK